jgi:hypothetical protein
MFSMLARGSRSIRTIALVACTCGALACSDDDSEPGSRARVDAGPTGGKGASDGSASGGVGASGGSGARAGNGGTNGGGQGPGDGAAPDTLGSAGASPDGAGGSTGGGNGGVTGGAGTADAAADSAAGAGGRADASGGLGGAGGADGSSDASSSDQHVHIFVSNTCVMSVSPTEITVPAGKTVYIDWHNHSADYPVTVWLSYGGGYVDLPTGSTWDEPIEHCANINPYTAYADISTACSRFRFFIRCL